MDVFDYLIPDELISKLEVGQIVNIPFKKSVIKGVVYDFAEKSEFKYIKAIDSLSDEKISSKLIEFIEWFSKYYYQSFGSVLKLVLPEKPKRKIPNFILSRRSFLNIMILFMKIHQNEIY